MVAIDFDADVRKQGSSVAYQVASLKEQKSARKAQDAYNQKRLELESQGLGLQADQIAKQYAIDQAKLEWDKESFREQFGHQVAQDAIDNAFREKQAALDETWRTAEQTGFREGVPTLATMKFNEETRQFDVGQQNNQRDFGEGQRRYDQDFGEDRRRYDQDFGESQRQFNVGQVLNAPRGPADWAAYQQKLRGLEAAGSMFGSSQPVASFSNGGQQTRPVLSNVDLALAATGQGDPSKLMDTPWQGAFGQQGVDPSTNLLAANRGPIYKTQQQGTGAVMMQDGGPPATSPSQQRASGGSANVLMADSTGGISMAPHASQPGDRKPTSANTGFTTNSENPYGGGQAHGSNAAARALGASQPQQQGGQAGNAASGAMSLPSIQRYRKFAPTEQQMGLGDIEANGGPTAEDSKWMMQRQAPNYERSKQARYAGM